MRSATVGSGACLFGNRFPGLDLHDAPGGLLAGTFRGHLAVPAHGDALREGTVLALGHVVACR